MRLATTIIALLIAWFASFILIIRFGFTPTQTALTFFATSILIVAKVGNIKLRFKIEITPTDEEKVNLLNKAIVASAAIFIILFFWSCSLEHSPTRDNLITASVFAISIFLILGTAAMKRNRIIFGRLGNITQNEKPMQFYLAIALNGALGIGSALYGALRLIGRW